MNEGTILVNLQRCTGCWTCSLACKVGNCLPDDAYRITVRTEGSGEGIDRPAGTWPDLHMSWIPIWRTDCTKCPERLKEGEPAYCVNSCPNGALTMGDAAKEEVEALRKGGFRIFTLPAWEDSKSEILYASK
jgi:Fe-S-cluster-containing dehydrogenase component